VPTAPHFTADAATLPPMTPRRWPSRRKGRA
jgi:hypothetical protein